MNIQTETIEQLKIKILKSEEESTQIILKLDKRITDVRNNLQISQEKCEHLTRSNDELNNQIIELTESNDKLNNQIIELIKLNNQFNKSTQTTHENISETSKDNELKYYIQEYLKIKKERDTLEFELNEIKQLCLQLVDKVKT